MNNTSDQNIENNKISAQEASIINDHSFAQILAAQTDKTGFSPLVYCPLQLLGNNQLLGHLQRNNPLIKAAELNPNVRTIFSGPHGYISARWHEEQAVPTWNYVSVSLDCTLRIMTNQADKLGAMASLSKHFEPQWNFAEFDQPKNKKMVQQMLAAITVFTLDIVEVNSQFKLSQNRSVACRTAFQQNLEMTGYPQLADIVLD